MTMKDIGPEPQSFDLEKATLENTNYRVVAWSGKYLQLTLMSIPVGEDIGLEAHPETDQFLRLDEGGAASRWAPRETGRLRPGGRGWLGNLCARGHVAQRDQHR